MNHVQLIVYFFILFTSSSAWFSGTAFSPYPKIDFV